MIQSFSLFLVGRFVLFQGVLYQRFQHVFELTVCKCCPLQISSKTSHATDIGTSDSDTIIGGPHKTSELKSGDRGSRDGLCNHIVATWCF